MTMTTITLSDYVGYIFTEIVRAREIADLHSREIAERYSKDEVLSSFSVPRFKIPEMNLTIPILVSGAKFNSVYKFTMTYEQFDKIIDAQLIKITNSLKINLTGKKITDVVKIDIIGTTLIRPRSSKKIGKSLDAESDAIKNFYDGIKEISNEDVRDQFIQAKFLDILKSSLKNANLENAYNTKYPNNEAFFEAIKRIKGELDNAFVIDKIKVENLLVTPLTNMVKSESDEKSVFTINAKIIEEGLFIKTVTDAEGKTKKLVDFE